jgi:glycosidase
LNFPSSSDPAERSLARIIPRLEAQFASSIKEHSADWQVFRARLNAHFPRLFKLLLPIYGEQYDFFYHLEMLLTGLAKSWIDRPADLKALDAQREADSTWFQSNQMVGGVCYVDLFGGDLTGIRSRIPYFKELGLTYLHLMPLFRVPQPENDGGYAISSYREVDPSLGTMAQLTELAQELRQNGISLVVDFVFNHTADQHDWALRARAGDPQYLDYYLTFTDRTLPDAYERSLREIFPDEHPGAFTYFPEMQRWVWTTFHSYQWDLNYRNPEVFHAMVQEMLSLANVGVEVLRLDAVAFIWKQMGTNCENLPEAHQLIQAFNAAARIAAPALLFKSEAIVHPDEVSRYICPDECQLSYNPLLMALLWETLATREVRLLSASLRERFKISPRCAWVNYVRCHDDIGWTFSDEDAGRLWINGFDHRRFLNAFYTGRFPGSFARGLPFQENPKTGDCRISGTCASLAGLEKALKEEGPQEVDLAIRRIQILYGVAMLIGGIPLIYLGDEIGVMNDTSFYHDPARARDSRWVHRPRMDWDRAALRSAPATIEGRIFGEIQKLIQIRKAHPVFSGGEVQIVETENPHVLGFIHSQDQERVLVLANFSEGGQVISRNLLRVSGFGETSQDLLGRTVSPTGDVLLEPYQLMALCDE